MATFLFKNADDVTPANFQLDFNDIDWNSIYRIPHWLSWSYWVTTTDVTAGIWSVDINWLDPNGDARVLNGGQLDLAGFGNTLVSNGVVPISRQSATSAWTFDALLTGLAATAKLSYRILVTHNVSECAQEWF